ncbi:glyoxalase/Bleomycin resistance /Dioxygenase superfamily protein, partial [Vibrio parahaemolyticus V-223/04]
YNSLGSVVTLLTT